MAANDRLAGVYKINDIDFPMPITDWPEENPLALGLNGLPILSSYKLHRWNWAQLEATYAELLFAAFADQQSSNTPLNSIETDPYDATGANRDYGTIEYDDVVILSAGARTRGMPAYDDVNVTFEVYIG